jgi:hypothetical protein
MQVHLAVLVRPDVPQQLVHYTKSLVWTKVLRPESRILPDEGCIKDHEVKQESQSKLALSNDREERIFEIRCQLAEHSTHAVGDYGAKKNFMKEGYVLRLGLPISRNAACKVTIGSGKQVTTVGATSVPFRFSGEDKVHNLEFQLLPNCIHNVIIGKPFLKLTKTFSNVANFCRRVKERVAGGISRFHFLYLGGVFSCSRGPSMVRCRLLSLIPAQSYYSWTRVMHEYWAAD